LVSASSLSSSESPVDLSFIAILLMSSQFFCLAWTALELPLLLATLLSVRSMMAMARSWFLSARFLALVLWLRPRFCFLLTPAPWWMASTEGRWLMDSGGGLTSFSDLSVSMPGEVALRASRECLDGAGS
jgi:hypothetical protein